MFTSPFRPLTFGEILDGAFTLYRRHFLTFFITALIPYVPVGIVSGWFSGSAARMGPTETPSLEMFGLLLLMLVVSFLAFVAMFGALTRQSSQAYTGQEVSLGDGYRQGLRSFFKILLSGFVVGLLFSAVMGVVLVVFGLLMGVALVAAGESGALAIVVTILMMLGMLLVMLAMGSLCFAIVPAIVVERRGPFDAIGRSFALAWGALPRVVGMVLVSYFIMILPILGVMMAMGLTNGFAALFTPGAMSPAAVAVQQLLGTLGYSLAFPFFVTTMVLLYYDRRARTEAHDLEGMVRELALAR
ncbi:MAG TPA: hypothetical protein VF746_05905 [Longimicrobium sp.]|jgi:hypothetical protein